MSMLLNRGIGLCGPVVGAIVLVGCAWPFWGVMFAVPVVITYLPSLALGLPHLLRLQRAASGDGTPVAVAA